MSTVDSKRAYVEHVARLESTLESEEAFKQAVGGEFAAIGKLEYYLLRSLGMKDGHRVVDIGCGSGRLACQLARFPKIAYVGTDVVQALLDYTAKRTNRPDWRFCLAEGTTIDCPSASADFVCFFSVFTHLLQEDTFRYFEEASRCLKPGGILVLSFLEFRIPSHWTVFFTAVRNRDATRHLDQFIDRDAIHVWARHSHFEVSGIFDGDKPHIPIPEEISWENGAVMGNLGHLGQSVAVLKKTDPWPGRARPAPEPTSA